MTSIPSAGAAIGTGTSRTDASRTDTPRAETPRADTGALRTGTPGTDTVIWLDHVTKTYSTGMLAVNALADISLAVHSGEYVAITGPSGSGKSTLMNIIGCLDVPTSGTYLLAGEDVSAMDEPKLARIRNRRIGFVFQRFQLMSQLTALTNVELPLLYADVPRHERLERARQALTRVGLADRLDHRPGELSGGQQQRVAIARALVTNPDLILADEPTGNLDSTASTEVLALLDEVNAAGKTVVLITHEHDVAAQAHRTIEVFDGRIKADSDSASTVKPSKSEQPAKSETSQSHRGGA